MTRKTSLTIPAAVAAAVAAVAGAFLIDAGPAQAQTAARVEAQTRPDFGLLLDPPTRARPRASARRWSYGDHRPGHGSGYPYPGHGYPPPHGTEQVVMVDCGGNSGSGAVEDAVRRLAPGGTLIIRGRSGACVGWLNIDKPLTIIGDNTGFDRRDWATNPTASLQAPDGLPCMTVASGVRVEVRDIVFESRRAGDAACIIGYGADIVLNRVGMRHGGDEAAIYLDGGRLDIRNAVVEADTLGGAIVADAATINAWGVDIGRSSTGMDITPGAGEPSRLYDVSMKGPQSPNSFGPRSIGLTVRAGRDYGRVEVDRSRICGFVEGVAVEGASVEIKDSKICQADKGAVLYSGELTLKSSRVRAEMVGVAAAAGRAVVTDNIFSGVRQMAYVEPRASLQASGNRVYSRHDICRPQFRSRYRDRYEPDFGYGGGRDYHCVYEPYPRDWWQEESGWYGMEYYDDGYRLDGYDRFQDGYGWYDQGGRYVQDERYRGDDRWREERRSGWW